MFAGSRWLIVSSSNHSPRRQDWARGKTANYYRINRPQGLTFDCFAERRTGGGRSVVFMYLMSVNFYMEVDQLDSVTHNELLAWSPWQEIELHPAVVSWSWVSIWAALTESRCWITLSALELLSSGMSHHSLGLSWRERDHPVGWCSALVAVAMLCVEVTNQFTRIIMWCYKL